MTQLTGKAIWINLAKLKIHWPYYPVIPEALAQTHQRQVSARMFLAMWIVLNGVLLKFISSPEPQNVALFGNKVVANIVI